MTNKMQAMWKLAKKEAENLKKNATPDELKKLFNVTIDPGDYRECIYGRMTGDCYSRRANELIVKCANKVYDTENGNFFSGKSPLNGKPSVTENGMRKFAYHSPIENLIIRVHGGEQAATVVQKYLTGETETFEIPST